MTGYTKIDIDTMEALAKELIARCFPDELFIFPVLWDQFLRSGWFDISIENVTQTKHAAANTWALAFADSFKVELSSTFGFMILAMTMKEMSKVVAPPPPHKIREAAEACASILGAPKDAADEIVRNLTDMLSSSNLCPAATTVDCGDIQHLNVDSRGNLIDKYGSFKIRSRQSSILFCELVRHNKVHLLDGFRLFRSWQRQQPKDVYEAFQIIVSRMRTAIGSRRLGIQIKAIKGNENDNTGYWQLLLPENVELIGSIVESKRLLQDAVESERQGQGGKSIRAALAAFQADHENMENLYMLARQLGAVELTQVEQHVIKLAANAIAKHERSLRLAQTAIGHRGERMECPKDGFDADSWPLIIAEFQGALNSMVSLVTEARTAIEAYVLDRRLLTDDDIALRVLSDYTHALEDPKRQTWALDMLIQNVHVKEILKMAEFLSRRQFPVTRKEGTDLQARLLSAFGEGNHFPAKDVSDYSDLKHLKRSWAQNLARAAFEILVMDKWALERNDVKLLLKYFAVLGKDGATHRQLSNEELCIKLKWTKNQLEKAEHLQNWLREKTKHNSREDPLADDTECDFFEEDSLDDA